MVIGKKGEVRKKKVDEEERRIGRKSGRGRGMGRKREDKKEGRKR